MRWFLGLFIVGLVLLPLAGCTSVSPAATTVPVPTPLAAYATPIVTQVAAPTSAPPPQLTPTRVTSIAPTPGPTATPNPTPSPSPMAPPTPHPGASVRAISAIPVLERFPVPHVSTPKPPPIPQGPFPTATPRPATEVNLGPKHALLTIGDYDAAIGAFDPQAVTITWSVGNFGWYGGCGYKCQPYYHQGVHITDEFFIDVLFDGTVLKRWWFHHLPNKTEISVENVKGLLDGIHITEGDHEFALVIDPLDSIAESNETDNTIVQVVRLAASEHPTVAPESLPNLAVAIARDKSEPIFASSHVEDRLSGKLTIEAPTYVTYGAGNFSIQYIEQDVELDLYCDDKLIRRTEWNLGADEIALDSFEDLRSYIDVSPGPHSLKVVVDPLNRIAESDQTDNEFETSSVWGIGNPLPAETPVVLQAPDRAQVTRANLTPLRPFGWDSGITAQGDNALVPPGKDTWLEGVKATRIDFAFRNASRISLPLYGNLEADVLLDGVLLERRSFRPGISNGGNAWMDNVMVPAYRASYGDHTVRVVLDPDGIFEEIDESDNVFERTFTWHDGPLPTAGSEFEMSDEELRTAFSPIFLEWRRDVLPVTQHGSSDRDWTPEIKAAGRAAYFLLTGRDLEQEGFVIHFDDSDTLHEDMVATCMSNWITLTESQYHDAFRYCTGDRGETGLKARSNGQIHIFVDTNLPPLVVLGSYLHELGHGLQDLRNPGQADQPYRLKTRGLLEAEAQIFEAASWRVIEEFMKQQLGRFPDVVSARNQFKLIFGLRRDGNTAQDIGSRLLWIETLSDPRGIGYADRLRVGGKLDSTFAMALFSRLVDIPAAEVEAWVDGLLDNNAMVNEFEQIASRRFESVLPTEDVGHPALHYATWTAP